MWQYVSQDRVAAVTKGAFLKHLSLAALASGEGALGSPLPCRAPQALEWA